MLKCEKGFSLIWRVLTFRVLFSDNCDSEWCQVGMGVIMTTVYGIGLHIVADFMVRTIFFLPVKNFFINGIKALF